MREGEGDLARLVKPSHNWVLLVLRPAPHGRREQPRTVVDPVVGRLEGFQCPASARLEAGRHNASSLLYGAVGRYECNVPSISERLMTSNE